MPLGRSKPRRKRNKPVSPAACGRAGGPRKEKAIWSWLVSILLLMANGLYIDQKEEGGERERAGENER